MGIFSRLWKLAVGSPRNPFNPETFRSIALIAFLAWVGLGADGLSSSCYGPEQAFLALGTHTHLALYVAIATAVTVFIISLGYNQVIELFPSGGGGYKVATTLLGPYAGLVSGSALIVDYILTIAVSIASGVDALFSLLPTWTSEFKPITEVALILLLMVLNLRGMKESIKILLPIFIGFVVLHVGLITYGIGAHSSSLPHVIPATLNQTRDMAHMVGWGAVIALMLHSYSLGSSTYTGLEAVSNNVNHLAEPRVRTGKWTMLYMAISLSFTAGGIILLYLLWHVHPVQGETLNAVVFRSILGDSTAGHLTLIATLAFEAGLLLVGGNTGFLGGPAVLSNMSLDSWLPNRFRHLSSRLVTQNGVIVFGLAAVAIIIWSRGHIALLAVLYSINVFITFTLSLIGLCVYWVKQREKASPRWRWRLAFSIFSASITASILIITLYAKFTEGGWVTLLITGAVITLCLLVKKHYNMVRKKLAALDAQFMPALKPQTVPIAQLDPQAPTAVFFIGKDRSVSMHTILWVMRMFPDHFKNFIFLSAGVVDIESFQGQQTLETMKQQVSENTQYFVKYCQQYGLAAESYSVYGTDFVNQLVKLSEEVNVKYPNCIFFASKLIFDHDNWITRLLHNETPMLLQRRLHNEGHQMVILPMKL
jgi:amino acid transporter